MGDNALAKAPLSHRSGGTNRPWYRPLNGGDAPATTTCSEDRDTGAKFRTIGRDLRAAPQPVSDPLTRRAAGVRLLREDSPMIDDSSATGTAPAEVPEICRRWAAPSRRGLMGAGAGFVAGAAAQFLTGEAAAAGAAATLHQLKRAERDPNHRILLKGGMVLSLDPAEAAVARRDLRLQHARHAVAEAQVGVPDNPGAQPAFAVLSACAHRRCAVDEFGFADRLQLGRAAGPVH